MIYWTDIITPIKSWDPVKCFQYVEFQIWSWLGTRKTEAFAVCFLSPPWLCRRSRRTVVCSPPNLRHKGREQTISRPWLGGTVKTETYKAYWRAILDSNTHLLCSSISMRTFQHGSSFITNSNRVEMLIGHVTFSAFWVHSHISVGEPGICRFTKLSSFGVTPVNELRCLFKHEWVPSKATRFCSVGWRTWTWKI